MVRLFRRPVPALAVFVDALWYVDEPLPAGRDRTLPTGSMQIVVNLAADRLHWYDGDRLADVHSVPGAGLCGALARPIGVDTADQAATVGVVFRPGGAAAFFEPPASALVEPVIGLDALWGRDGATLRERVLEAPTPERRLAAVERVLLDRLTGTADAGLGHAVAALDRGASVGDVTERLGASASTFQRRFRAAVGLAPKRFARVRRLQRVLRTVTTVGDDVDWALVAVEHGYVDQAHLINDFRALAGVTPGRYRPRSAAEHNHVPLGAT